MDGWVKLQCSDCHEINRVGYELGESVEEDLLFLEVSFEAVPCPTCGTMSNLREIAEPRDVIKPSVDHGAVGDDDLVAELQALRGLLAGPITLERAKAIRRAIEQLAKSPVDHAAAIRGAKPGEDLVQLLPFVHISSRNFYGVVMPLLASVIGAIIGALLSLTLAHPDAKPSITVQNIRIEQAAISIDIPPAEQLLGRDECGHLIWPHLDRLSSRILAPLVW